MFEQLLPNALKEFLPFISPAAFNLVSKMELFKRLTEIASNCLKASKTEELRASLSKIMPAEIQTVARVDQPIEILSLSPHFRIAFGEAILKLYFAQLYNPGGVFCDLRPVHFETLKPSHAPAATVPSFGWAPPSYWFKFDENFRQGLIGLYDGYYLNDSAAVDAAIEKLGLVPKNPAESDLKKIREVFQKHFGPGEQEEVEFSLAKFKVSFQNIFEVLVAMKRQIPVDFALLGIYLVGMYWALEQTAVPLNVRKIYLELRSCQNQKHNELKR